MASKKKPGEIRLAQVKSDTLPADGTPTRKRASGFDELGFKATIASLHDEIRELYLADDVPWIIGYSGGKDSTATLQLIWAAILAIPESHRNKPVHVISTDTLVENPIVSAWVGTSMSAMREAAKAQKVPIIPTLLRPRLEDSFWVNLIGRGYPAPRPKFRSSRGPASSGRGCAPARTRA